MEAIYKNLPSNFEIIVKEELSLNKAGLSPLSGVDVVDMDRVGGACSAKRSAGYKDYPIAGLYQLVL